MEDHRYVRPIPVAPPAKVSNVLPEPQKTGVETVILPAAGVPVQGIVIVWLVEAATGFEPVSEAPLHNPKLLKAVVPRLIVLPGVALPLKSAVINKYPVEPGAILCDVNVGNTWLPAPIEAVFVESRVAVPELNVGDVWYQHFRFTRSPAT